LPEPASTEAFSIAVLAIARLVIGLSHPQTLMYLVDVHPGGFDAAGRLFWKQCKTLNRT
jgi:hypothetical protein